jgi:ATP-dependent RNA helicase RhlE
VFGVAMSGQDVCGIAQTGTGKTVAYVLPCLMHWKFAKVKDPQVLIIVPTRELVVQVLETILELAKYTNATAVGVFGGEFSMVTTDLYVRFD